jgi:hypothetical protein
MTTSLSRQQGRERGAVDAGHRAQGKLGDRHQRAGVTGTDRRAGIAALHRVDRHAHRCGPGPPQRLAGLFLTADHVGGMEDFGRTAQVGMLVQRGLDPLLIAHEQEVETVMAPARKRGALNHHAHAFIPAHRVDSDTRETHRACPLLTSLEPDRDDLAPVVVATRVTQVVRTLEFTAIAALVKRFRLERVVTAAHAPARGRSLSFRDSHCGTCSCKFVSLSEGRPRPRTSDAQA